MTNKTYKGRSNYYLEKRKRNLRNIKIVAILLITTVIALALFLSRPSTSAYQMERVNEPGGFTTSVTVIIPTK